MTRPRRGGTPESVVARLRRLGILGEVDVASGRRIVWSEDFRTVVDGGPDPERWAQLQEAMASDDPATVKASLAEEVARVRAELDADPHPERRRPRLTTGDLITFEQMGPPETFALREMAVLDYLRKLGIVEAFEIDPETMAIRIELSEPYRRLMAAGREPDREPGFDAAWEAGGPQAVRAWLEEEAGLLPETGAPIVRSPVDLDLGALIAETYGPEAERFMLTPRASLGGRSPMAAIAEGDIDAVRGIVLKDTLGDWV